MTVATLDYPIREAAPLTLEEQIRLLGELADDDDISEEIMVRLQLLLTDRRTC